MSDQVFLPGQQAYAVLQALAEWGDLTTIVLHGGCVFEFKGPFPGGQMGDGFYHFGTGERGFQGHLNLTQVARILFQERSHRGRDSYALVFANNAEEAIFKVFLGRDERGEVYPAQWQAYQQLKSQGGITRQEETR